MQGIEMLIVALIVGANVGYVLSRITNRTGCFKLARNKRQKMGANEQHYLGVIRVGFTTTRAIITPSEMFNITNRAEKNPEDFA